MTFLVETSKCLLDLRFASQNKMSSSFTKLKKMSKEKLKKLDSNKKHLAL
jgi:hypothetical protein